MQDKARMDYRALAIEIRDYVFAIGLLLAIPALVALVALVVLLWGASVAVAASMLTAHGLAVAMIVLLIVVLWPRK